MKICIVSIGNELLSGETINTNATWMGKKLTALGCSILEQITIPDQKESITNTLSHNVRINPDFVLCTGGLGPTTDDITRQTLFDFVGTKSKFDENYWQYLTEKFQRSGIEIPESNRSQALIPIEGDVIQNPIGSARGYKFKISGVNIISLPGVPDEMKSMMQETVIPYIQSKGVRSRKLYNLMTTGIPESALIEQIASVTEKDHGCDIGYYPALTGVNIRIAHKNKESVKRLGDEIKNILGVKVYSENGDSIESVIVRLAKEKNKTIAIAESCTGGLIGHRLTDVSGSSDIFRGSLVVYSNQSKIDLLDVDKALLERYGSVSTQTAESMAENVMKKFSTNIGISVTGIAGPTGGTEDKPVGLIYIGLAHESGVKVKEIRYGNDRKRNKLRTSQAALNLLRLFLLKIR